MKLKSAVPSIHKTGCIAKQDKTRKTEVEKAMTKQKLDNAKGQTRVSIGMTFRRW